MKFAKTLEHDSTQPELHLLYKQLKKQLKIFDGVADAGSKAAPSSSEDSDDEPGSAGAPAAATAALPADAAPAHAPADAPQPQPQPPPQQQQQEGPDAAQEARFVALVEQCVNQLNEDYLSREEMLVIKADLAESAAASANSHEELLAAYTSVVNVHGELVLLCHWSMCAYTALVKILKKHHKRTGHRVRSALLANLLGQPFCSVEDVRGLVRSAEQRIADLAQRLGLPPSLAPTVGTAAAAAVRDAGEQGASPPPQRQLKAELERCSAPGMVGAAAGDAGAAAAAAAAAAAEGPASELQQQVAAGAAAAAATPQQEQQQQQQPAGAAATMAQQQGQQQGQQQQAQQQARVTMEAAAGRPVLKRDRSKQYSRTNKRHEGDPLWGGDDKQQQAQSSGSSMQVSQGGSEQQQQSGGAVYAEVGSGVAAAAVRRSTNIMQRTRAALQLWKSLRSNASTPSTVLVHPPQASTAVQQHQRQ